MACTTMACMLMAETLARPSASSGSNSRSGPQRASAAGYLAHGHVYGHAYRRAYGRVYGRLSAGVPHASWKARRRGGQQAAPAGCMRVLDGTRRSAMPTQGGSTGEVRSHPYRAGGCGVPNVRTCVWTRHLLGQHYLAPPDP